MTVSVTPIRFEHHRGALGIGESAPRLSWIVDHAPAGWRQARYEIEAAAAGTAVVDRPESVLVPWPFAPLSSRERRELRVRVVGEDGSMSEWSDWATVEAGLLERADWQADLVGPRDSRIAAPLVRGTFTIRDAAIRRARIYATAHGLYELELNGARVGDQQLAPGWTAYESRLRYQTYDVTDLVTPGANAVGAWLGDGWWRGYLGWDGRRELYGTDLGVLVQLEVEYADGERQVVASGPEWVSAASPISSADLYNGEHFDARNIEREWSAAGFDDGAWTPVEVRDLGGAELVAPDGPPVRHVETLHPREVLTSPSGATILDFGQNLVGRLRIRVRGEAGTTIALRHAEVLEHGEPATAPLRGAKATDSYTLRGEGVEEWAPRFTFHGFRYAEVTGWVGDLQPDDIVAEVLHSDLHRTGWFASSDPLVNRLHENAVWGMRGNFVDVPTDCPQRDERLGWTGDLQVFAPTAEFLYDSAGFLTSWLRDLAAEQRRYGGTPMVVPAITTGYQGPMAGWADAATVVPWSIYRAYGDLGILEAQFDSMAAWVDEVAAAAGEDRIWSKGFQFGDWLDPTAPAGRPEAAQTYPEIVATAYFARSSRIVADAAALLGRVEDAARYGRLAEEVRGAFHREYVSGSGRLLSDSATAYALALQFGLVDGEPARAHAAGRLAELVRGNGYKISTGFIGTPLVCDALSANGHADVAYRLLLQTEAPSWLYTVTQGATTIWERWDSLLPDGTVNPSGMTSFNHYAFGSVADWLHRVVAGLAPAEPGYRRIRIAPQPPRRGVTSAAARLQTPYGEASVSWTLADVRMTLSATVPVGAVADVILPSGASVTVEHGAYEWSEPFEVDPVERPAVTVDTPMGALIDDAEAMSVFVGVVTKYVPEAAAHMSGGLNGRDDVTPRQIAGMMPHSDDFLADLERGFAAVTAGEPIPVDLFEAAPSPADDDLVDAAGMLSGRDFWSTREGDGIRSLVLVDGPHGVRRQTGTADNLGFNESLPATCFPPGAGLGSTWNPALIREVGEALGCEARALDVDVLLGPAINIKRSPLGGRTFEYFSEDPLLTGILATGYVQGVQSTGVGTSLKHFAVNNQETDRMRVSAEVDDRALREIYLPAFERVVTQAHPTTVMSAYNAINGVFASENEWLLTDLLRGEWGFDGLVVSDWGAIKDRVEALRAGLDLEMPGTGDAGRDAIVDAVRDGRIDRGLVDRSLERLRALADRTRPSAADPSFDEDAHHALARRAAGEAIVLLRNERGTLPLRAGQRVAVLGELAATPQYQGGGSSHVNPTRLDIPLEQLRRVLADVSYAPGYSTDPSADHTALLGAARAAAEEADVAVVFVGLYEKDQSEGFDRTHLDLPPQHVALIQSVAAVAQRTVVVLSNGGVVSLEPWHDSVDAIVEGWALGQAVGSAIADVLTGAVNPSGRLAESIPFRLQDTPSYLTFPGENEIVRYSEGVFVGYRWYTTAESPVRYPFGHGLSYTGFTQELEVEASGPDSARARVIVRNTGHVGGAEVVQVYVAPAASPVRRPARELAGFAKVELEPGESTVIEIPLDRRAFAYWDVAKGRWRVEPGTYRVELGRSSVEISASADLPLEGDIDSPEPLTLDSTVGSWFGHPLVGPALMQAMMAGASEEQLAAASENENMLKMVESMPMGQFARFPGVEIPDEALEQLIELSRVGSPG
ncbi:family 78 glycoside hydrolase catalytic domain [Microbacterium rhizosphaerae]|uniref:alpha-L-rhamnosidase n=1 Tax=Microbacterium rhizosphaerae TaxID=1678237 RepID=A0ABZ0SKM3_9MICO|nr:family 78 glycoside hydrolase catalytic domain [Microbacterium rhizosphaerae]WPR89439.1 family 78 glycoside hydrolase catalytic domain [Microbacterium rhizosphaerae]